MLQAGRPGTRSAEAETDDSGGEAGAGSHRAGATSGQDLGRPGERSGEFLGYQLNHTGLTSNKAMIRTEPWRWCVCIRW